MMKKYLLLLLLVIPINVFADKVTISCSPTVISVGDTITCAINGESAAEVRGMEANITLSSGLSLISYSKNGDWNGGANNLAISQYLDNSKVGTFNIGTIVVKAATTKASYKVGLSNVEFTNKDYQTYKPGDAETTVFVASDDNNLKTLSVNEGILTPTFNSNTTEYTISNYVNSTININAVANDTNAVVAGAGVKNVNLGENTFSILVTSQSKKTKTYTIKVTRVDNRSDNANLSSLTISSGELSPTFSSNITTYVVSNFAENAIVLNATAEDNKANITGLGTKVIGVGTTVLSITVTAENGNKKIYKITVTKQLNVELKLKSFTVSDTNIAYNDNKNAYSATVDNTINEVKIEAVTNDNKTTVTGTGVKSLKTGKNTFKIYVYASNKELRIITVTINKEEDKTSSNLDTNFIISNAVVINGTDITLTEEQLEYSTTVDSNTNSIDIHVDEPSNYKVEITGNENFVEGNNIVTIKVTNIKTNTTKTYTINVVKEAYIDISNIDEISSEVKNEVVKGDQYKIPFYVMLGLCLIESIGLVFIYIRINKKSSN